MSVLAVIAVSTANANVFYELGIRHAVRPASTALVFAGNSRLPFDVGLLRALPYALDPAGNLANADADRQALAKRLRVAREAPATDSPIEQLVQGFPFPGIARLRTDVVRERIEYSTQAKEALADARRQGVDAVRAAETNLGPLADVEAGVIVDLFLSYRAVKGWADMVALVEKMPAPLRETVLVREQLALALNRLGQGEKAERILLDLIAARGPSSETSGLLGRVYKDRWDAALKQGNPLLARGLLDKAIDAYLKGFETDWRDAYPGINAVTLMELRDPPDPRRVEVLPVGSYAVERRLAARLLNRGTDYWDHATRLELAVLAKNESRAAAMLGDALAAVREKWEPETTARNLHLIREARERRGDPTPWVKQIEDALLSQS